MVNPVYPSLRCIHGFVCIFGYSGLMVTLRLVTATELDPDFDLLYVWTFLLFVFLFSFLPSSSVSS